MGFFKYPYTDLNELNLDWVIAKIKYIEQAKNIIFDNSGTPLISNNVQDVIEEIYTMISSQGVTSFNGRSGVVSPEAGDYTATQVTYDNTGTGYNATDVQAAIDEADAKINGIAAQIPATIVEDFNGRSGSVAPAAGDYNGTQVTYDNTVSGLAATDLQAAVDELAAAPGGVTSFNTRTGAVVPAASDYTATQVDFDDTVAQTGSSDVQGALEYVATRGSSAALTTYDNTQSGLTATNVQAAIDEVANDVLSSGVASFNGRTGAVNPAINDYDLSMLGDVNVASVADGDVLKYDANSLKWIPGTGASISGYVFDHEEVISETNQATITGTRLKNIADAALAYLSGMGADKIAFLTCFKRGVVGYVPRSTMYAFTNSILSFDEYFFNAATSGAQNITRIMSWRATGNASDTAAKELQLTTAGAGTYTDYTSTTFAADFEIHFMVFKQA